MRDIEQTLLLPSDMKLGICHQMAPLQMLYVMILTYICKIAILKCEHVETVEASTKMPGVTLMQVDIRYQMA